MTEKITEIESDGLIHAAEVARMIGVPVNTIHQLVHQKRIPHVRLGRRFVRFSSADIREWISIHSVSAGLKR